MICPHCGKEHPAQARFCPTTGQVIVQNRYCPQCGQVTEADWRVCGFCGHPIGSQPNATAAAYQQFALSDQQPILPRWAMWTGGGVLALVVILLIVAIVFRMPGRLSGRYDAVAEKMPDSTDMYLGLNLLEVVQMQDTEQLGLLEAPLMLLFGDEMQGLSGLSGSGASGLDIQASINTFLQAEFGMDLTEDIIPWAGQYVGIGFDLLSDQFGHAGNDEMVIIAMEVRNSGAADDFIVKLRDNLENMQGMDFSEREYQGVLVYTDQYQDLSFGRIGQLIAFSPSEDALLNMIDRIESNQTLGENPVYRKLVAQAPSGSLARVFLKEMTMADWINNEMGSGMGLISQFLSSPVAPASQGALISVVVNQNGLKFDSLTAFDADSINIQEMGTIGGSNDLLKMLPEDALIVFSGNDFGRRWRQLPLAAGLSGLDTTEFGFSLTQDLFNHLDGDWVLSLQPAQEGWLYQTGMPLGGVFVARSNHIQELQWTVELFNQFVAQEGGVQLQTHPFLDGQLYEVMDRDRNRALSIMAYSASGGHLFFGTSAHSINSLYDRGGKLSDTPNYRKISAEISSGLSPTFFLDVEGFQQHLEQSLLFRSSELEELQPFIQNLAAIGAAQGLARDDILHGELIFVSYP
jgi:hypothetical protein